MKIVNIKSWAFPPFRGEVFRIEKYAYKCYFVVGNYALIGKF